MQWIPGFLEGVARATFDHLGGLMLHRTKRVPGIQTHSSHALQEGSFATRFRRLLAIGFEATAKSSSCLDGAQPRYLVNEDWTARLIPNSYTGP